MAGADDRGSGGLKGCRTLVPKDGRYRPQTETLPTGDLQPKNEINPARIVGSAGIASKARATFYGYPTAPLKTLVPAIYPAK